MSVCDVQKSSLNMLDCQESSNDFSCKHCQENGDSKTYWGIQLDQDLLETIVSIYPEWFKDCNLTFSNMADSNIHHMTTEDGKIIIPLYHTRDMESPPKAVVDDASLQKAMNKNKESLKVKLMLRRPINQLVEQGIIPPLKASPHFHEQRQKLERAKMGDILKNKIQRRPDRQELIQQHILEDTTIDPSLQDKQRQLKKARLADDLNDRLSHRPGPLELIKGNILQTDEKFAQAVKEGHIPFKRTCEGQTQKHPPPRFLIDEDSGSESAPSPQDIADHSQSSIPSLEISGTSTPMQGSPESLIDIKPCIPIAETNNNNHGCLSHISVQSAGTIIPSLSKVEGSSGKTRKKSKSKSQPKTRTIKFHEYKGPPNAQKNQSAASVAAETSYELLLQQQQLFLQWQLEWQQKYPQIILPAAQKPTGDQGSNSGNISTQLNDQSVSQESMVASVPRNFSKLEDMKVSDLKAELKRRNLPVSGSKPQLIERLKPYSEISSPAVSSFSDALTNVTTVTPANSLPLTVGNILVDTITTKNESVFPSVTSPNTSSSNTVTPTVNCKDVTLGVYQIPSTITQFTPSRPPSVVPMDVDSTPNMSVEIMDMSDNMSPLSNEDIVKMQQKKIEELQRELQRSQRQLQQQQQQQNIFLPQTQSQQLIVSAPIHIQSQSQPGVDNSASKTVNHGSVVDPNLQRQMLQHFQHKIQQQQISQQQQQQQQQAVQQREQQPSGNSRIPNASSSSQPSSAAVKASLAAFLHNHHAIASLANVSIASPIIPLSQIASTQPVVSTPATVITAQNIPSVEDQIRQCVSEQETADPPSPVTSTSISKHDICPNGISQRKSSLPNFNTLITTKQVEKRALDDSQFIPKPPPDYNEATKQLVSSQSVQQQQSSGHFMDQNSNRVCDEKIIQSQAVDDVLEILIKNGELPPSAAQYISVNSKASKSSPVCPTYSPVVAGFSAKPHHSTSPSIQLNSDVASTTPDLIIGNTSMTSPPSTSLMDSENNTNTPLDFDFHLDLEDIEAMDLGGVLNADGPNNCVPKLESNQLPCALSSGGNSQQSVLPENNNSIIMSDKTGNMDVELSDWLDVIIPSANTVSTSSSSNPSVNVNTAQNNTHNSYRNNDPDPLLSTLANSNDPYELFTIENFDFKTPTTELNLHTWDKVDFAT